MFIFEKLNGADAKKFPRLIDKHRGLEIRLISSPGYPDGGEPLFKFELLALWVSVAFSASKSEKWDANDKVEISPPHISWVVRKLSIRNTTDLSLNELRSIISEALEVMGRPFISHNNRAIKSFRIRFTEYEQYNYIPYEKVSYWD
jgi:hypothetical protein